MWIIKGNKSAAFQGLEGSDVSCQLQILGGLLFLANLSDRIVSYIFHIQSSCWSEQIWTSRRRQLPCSNHVPIDAREKNWILVQEYLWPSVQQKQTFFCLWITQTNIWKAFKSLQRSPQRTIFWRELRAWCKQLHRSLLQDSHTWTHNVTPQMKSNMTNLQKKLLKSCVQMQSQVMCWMIQDDGGTCDLQRQEIPHLLYCKSTLLLFKHTNMCFIVSFRVFGWGKA